MTLALPKSMNTDEMQSTIEQLKQFRQQLYTSIPYRADATMEVLDALSSNANAQSVVELSLNPSFRRNYKSVYDVIEHFFEPSHSEPNTEERQIHEQQLMRLISSYLPEPQHQRFWLLGVDVTSAPRPFAYTLEDRGYVYYPNAVAGNKPVTIGHQYSALVLFPHKQHTSSSHWAVPLSLRRVTTQETKRSVGVAQVKQLLNDETLPFHQQLCVQVADSDYSAVSYLGEMTEHENLVIIAQVRSNRVFYRMPSPDETSTGPGHPTWYGQPFDLKEPNTWGKPDQVMEITYTSHGGHTHKIQLECWHDMLMRGTSQYPMHQHPFMLIRARVFNESGEQVFQRPLWLSVFGQRRKEISLQESWEAYKRRYDIEHFFRFGKRRLLMIAYQTPEVQHEENWWQIVQLAYMQLWLSRNLAEAMPTPWERYLPQFQTHSETQEASPSMTQRSFSRIIQEIGTPAKIPKPRGKSPGRTRGARQKPRKRQKVIKKSPVKQKRAKKTA